MDKKVVKNSLIYTMSGLLIKCFNFFLLPVYAAYLTTGDYGITSIATSFLNTMSYVVTFSLFSAVMRFFVDLKEDAEKLKRFYGTVTCFVFISGACFIALLSSCRSLLTRYVFSGVDFYPVVFICLITMVFNCQHLIYENILRSQQKAMKCSLLSIGYFLILLVCNILFVVVFKMGATGVVLATLIGAAAYTVFFLVDMCMHKTIRFCIDFQLLKEALKYSVPIMPHNLSPQIAELVAKSLLGGVTSLGTVGVFSIATQFGSLADTVQIYVNNAYGPWLFEKLHAKDGDYKTSIRKMVRLLCSVIGVLFVGLALFSQDYILLLMNESYAHAWHYIPFVILKFAIKTPYWFYINILLYNKKSSKTLFIATLTGSIINVVFASMMIPAWGVPGSLTADLLAMLIRVIIVVTIGRREEDIGLYMRDFLLNFLQIMVCVFGGLSLSYFVFGNTFSVWNFGFKVLVFLAYALMLCCQHRAEAATVLRKFIKKRAV